MKLPLNSYKFCVLLFVLLTDVNASKNTECDFFISAFGCGNFQTY